MTNDEAIVAAYNNDASMVFICLAFNVSTTKIRAIVRACQDNGRLPVYHPTEGVRNV